MAVQLRFFPSPRPLAERFPRDFFRNIPSQPGVYLMQDATGKIIYVGKAKNLKQRLGSYRYIQPETASRKSMRLVQAVEKITWEILVSDLEAQIRENYLLRTLRPKFNRANVYPAAYCFIALRKSEQAAELVITREHLPGATHFGAFKTSLLFAMAALRRLLWLLKNPGESLLHAPASLRKERLAGNAHFTIPAEFLLSLENFLSGVCDGILQSLQSSEPPSHFEKAWLAQDAELLKNFFDRSLVQNRRMKEQFQVTEPTIAQEDLNDFLLRSRLTPPVAAFLPPPTPPNA